jgi:FkbM family methyltransferase
MNLGTYIIPPECKMEVVVDIGANEGSFLQMVLSYNPKVLNYYEANPIMFEKLVEKYPDIVGYNEAVYSVDNEIVSVINHKSPHPGNVAIYSDILNNDWVKDNVIAEVPTVSLETIIGRVGGYIDYLKVDCETSEYHLLLDKDLRNIHCIGMEIHCQVGKELWDRLLSHISVTHDFAYPSFQENTNKEIICVSKL